MKIQQLFATFLLFLLGGTLPLAGQIDPAEKGLLWRITGPEQQTTSYLFGTIHMIPAEDFELTEATQNALAESDRIAFEINMEEMQNPANLLGIMDQLYMANDTSLQDLLTDEEYTEVDAHFRTVGLPLSLLARMKPMFLSVMADADMTGMGQSEGTIKSYELELNKLATAQEKDVFGLETMEFQMSLFDAIPYRDQADMLLAAIRAESDTTGEGQFDRMVELYKAGDIQAMVSMMSEEESGMNSNVEDMLLLKRNRSWIPLMQEAMREGSVFFAVGAGHLGGEVGVISLLRQAGYKVEVVN